MGSLITKFLLGGVAGLLSWLMWEHAYPKGGGDASMVESYMVLTAGALIGAVVGGLTGFQRGGRRHTLSGLGFGIFFGTVGISIGYQIAGAIQQAMLPPGVFTRTDISIVTKIIGRVIVLSIIGAFLGLAVGASTLNVKRAIQGVVGGVIAGLVSGAVFDIVGTMFAKILLTSSGQMVGDVGAVSRALTFLLLGSTVALFIGIVDLLARSAWLRLSLGRNEGKEWSIDSNQTFIGRSEGASVPLFGDMNIAPIHAWIQRQQGQYILIDGGSPLGTFLNGQRISQVPLFHGAHIQIGSYTLEFLMKNMAAPARGPEAYPGQAYQMQQAPVPQQVPQPVAMAPTQMMPQQGYPTQVMSAPQSQPTMAYGAPLQHGPRGHSLVAIDGPLMGQRFPVQGPTDLGRECPAIPMSFDTAASRRHANISPAPNGLSVADAGSTNGTFVNGQRVSQAMAGPGDLIKVGSTTFRVEAA
ncbi:MAG: FHA domain-containing protein [Fimbriimonas sp.]